MNRFSRIISLQRVCIGLQREKPNGQGHHIYAGRGSGGATRCIWGPSKPPVVSHLLWGGECCVESRQPTSVKICGQTDGHHAGGMILHSLRSFSHVPSDCRSRHFVLLWELIRLQTGHIHLVWLRRSRSTLFCVVSWNAWNTWHHVCVRVRFPWPTPSKRSSKCQWNVSSKRLFKCPLCTSNNKLLKFPLKRLWNESVSSAQ